MNSDANWAEVARQFQETLGASMQKAVAAMSGTSTPLPPVVPTVLMQGLPNTMEALPALQFDPAKMLEIQQAYIKDASTLWNNGLSPQSESASASTDRRFASEAWHTNPLSHFSASAYMLNSQALMGMADAVEGDEKTKARVRFAVEQWLAAAAPSNFLALNAEAQQKAIDTKGQSIAQGLQNLMHDMRQGHVSMTDESNFEVGKNVATTEGSVVFENAYFQLLEYKPLTAKVYEKPLLLVPPCINKFYILDLQPANSLIRYAVEQGHRTFVVSWRNPDESMQDKTWDDYIENAAIEAIKVTREITGAQTINALGFCVGGTILATALAVLAARGEKPVSSVTFLTSLLDFSDTGILDIFIDETAVKFREMQMGQGGLLKGQDLASTFSFLRPNDLVWNYVVGNYLKGETPPPFDLLYWNADSTRMPAKMHSFYLRRMYQANDLRKPGGITLLGTAIDLRKIKVPSYLISTREDHIAPWKSTYRATQLFSGPVRFVLAASGHIAGVVNPPEGGKYSHWVNEELPASPDEWFAGATELAGSWWPDWQRWVSGQDKAMVPARVPGEGKLPALEDAPGSYVRVMATD